MKINKIIFPIIIITTIILFALGSRNTDVGKSASEKNQIATVVDINRLFNRNLYYGLRNDNDVKRLQAFLKDQGLLNISQPTGNYFSGTVNAVKKFQVAHNISPATGYFGPLTRAEVNILLLAPEDTGNRPVDTAPLASTPAQEIKTESATSTYYEKVRISSVNRYSDIKPENEYIIIENVSTTSEPVSITGLKITNSKREEFTIPKGHNLPGIDAIARDEIVLQRYGRAKIITGRQDKQMNFRENICIGYFNQNSNFSGAISNSCPGPDLRSAANRLPDHCINVFENTRSCRTVDSSKIAVAECIEYADAHYNYQGCVNEFKNQSNFFSKNWIIWMQRGTRFLRDTYDVITLYDKNGKIVDTYSY